MKLWNKYGKINFENSFLIIKVISIFTVKILEPYKKLCASYIHTHKVDTYINLFQETETTIKLDIRVYTYNFMCIPYTKMLFEKGNHIIIQFLLYYLLIIVICPC